MSKAVMLVAPYAVELIKEGLNICNSIMQYRHAALQVEVHRKSMHRQADQLSCKSVISINCR